MKTNVARPSIRPLFSDLDRRRRIPIGEVAEVTGFPVRVLRDYALDGTIPGGAQAGPHKVWTFDREQLEKWWREFNQPKRQLTR